MGCMATKTSTPPGSIAPSLGPRAGGGGRPAVWFRAEPGPGGGWTRQLTLIAESTYRWVEPFVSQYDDVVFRPTIPEPPAFTPVAKKARILYMPSQYEHMQLVTEGKALPVLLAQTRISDL